MMNVPCSVISGRSPRKSSCSLTSPLTFTVSSARTRSGAPYVVSRWRHSRSEYLGSSSRYSVRASDIREPVKSSIGEISSNSSRNPSRMKRS